MRERVQHRRPERVVREQPLQDESDHRAARFAADGRRRKNGGTASAHQPSARRGKRGLRIHPRPIRFIRTVEHEAEHLLEVAEEGESAETPAIMLGMVVLVLLPVFAMMLCAAFAAYYLT